MMAEQGAESGRGHGLSTMAAFEADEQRKRVSVRPLQPQIILQDVDDWLGQRQESLLVSLTEDAHLCRGQLEILELNGEHFTGPQAIEQHQTRYGQVAKGTKAAPEGGDFIGGKRRNDSLWLLQAQTQGVGAARPAITERRSLGVNALEMAMAGANLGSIVEAI